ncbi:hypothetical protein [Kitasatospora sp. NPDC101183]|uniref:hypothetical protein n=1 Tax=Kitasatospora sp. NPDC101183 TaxID=3364100 RepID=UPI00382C0792
MAAHLRTTGGGGMHRSPALAAALLLALTPLLAACDSGSASPPKPTTEIVLPGLQEAHDAASPYPVSTVTLAVGQSLGVRGALPSGKAWIWTTTSTGDAAVVRPGPDFITDRCAKDMIGCSDEGDQVFVAVAPGTTTLSWRFIDRGRHCSATQGASADPACAKASTKSVEVTVR